MPYENKECERFLALRRFWEYVGLELPHNPWWFDDQKPEQSIRELDELRNIALQLKNMWFMSPPILWHSNTRRALHWGEDLVSGNFRPWKEFKRYSGQVSVAIFYPSERRDFDYMLCVNKHMPVGLTRILDVRFHEEKKLRDATNAVGLEFEYLTSRPMLFPKEPKGCTLEDIRSFITKLGQLREKVGCSIRELGECSPFI